MPKHLQENDDDILQVTQAPGAARTVEDFIKRWPIEVTYEKSRAHLRIETQHQWAALTIDERSTPYLLGLHSLVDLLGYALHPDGTIPLQRAA